MREFCCQFEDESELRAHVDAGGVRFLAGPGLVAGESVRLALRVRGARGVRVEARLTPVAERGEWVEYLGHPRDADRPWIEMLLRKVSMIACFST